jgi:hypothetical protein
MYTTIDKDSKRFSIDEFPGHYYDIINIIKTKNILTPEIIDLYNFMSREQEVII